MLKATFPQSANAGFSPAVGDRLEVGPDGILPLIIDDNGELLVFIIQGAHSHLHKIRARSARGVLILEGAACGIRNDEKEAWCNAPEVVQLSSLHMVSPAGKRAAVVDNTPVNLRILDKQLRRWSMEPALFERAGEAPAWLGKHPPVV